MTQDRKPTHPDDARDGAIAVRRFSRALVGPGSQIVAESLAHEALAAARIAAQRGGDPVERALAEVVRLNRRRLKAHAAAAREDSGQPDIERRENLPSLIASLSLDEREVLLVVALAQFGYEAAGRILDVPYSSVVSRLMRARSRLDAARAHPTNRIGHLRLVQ